MSPLPLSPEASNEAVVAFARSRLAALARPEDAAPMAAYMKTTQPFFGVKAGPRRSVERALRVVRVADAARYRSLVRALWAGRERELQYLALDVAERHRRFITAEQLDLYEELVRQGQWWDLVDPVASKLVGLAWSRDRTTVDAWMDRWIDDDNLWIRRTAILGQLKHKQHTDRTRLFRYCLQCAPETDFFIRKAIGWALRAYGDVAPHEVCTFLEQHWGSLSPLSQREAARKLIARGWTAPV